MPADQAETEADAGVDGETEAETGAGAESEAEAGTDVEAEAGTDVEAEAGGDVEAEAGTETDVGTDVEAEADDPTRFELPATSDIRTAVEIQDRCRAALEADGDVTIGCGSVERVDAAILQCLGSLSRDLVDGGRHLDLTEPSEPFTRAVNVLGFGPVLEPSP